MTIDTDKLRALLENADNAANRWPDFRGQMLADEELHAAAVNALPELLDELERHAHGAEELRAELDETKSQLGLAGGGTGRSIAQHVADLQAEVGRMRPVYEAACGFLDKARKCVDRPYMGCPISHDDVESWLGDAIDAARGKP